MKLVDEIEADWNAEVERLEGEITRLRNALKIVVDSGANSARTASHKYADVVIAWSAYEVAREALQ